MYYCLVREEPNPAILSIHSTEEDAYDELNIHKYEDVYKEQLDTLNAYIEGRPNLRKETLYTIIPCKGATSEMSYEERKKRITERYIPLIEEAEVNYEIKRSENNLKIILQNERQSQEQRKEIEAFMLKWETCDSDIRTIWIDKIKPIVRSYLLKKNDTEIREWMRDRFIV